MTIEANTTNAALSSLDSVHQSFAFLKSSASSDVTSDTDDVLRSIRPTRFDLRRIQKSPRFPPSEPERIFFLRSRSRSLYIFGSSNSMSSDRTTPISSRARWYSTSAKLFVILSSTITPICSTATLDCLHIVRIFQHPFEFWYRIVR